MHSPVEADQADRHQPQGRQPPSEAERTAKAERAFMLRIEAAGREFDEAYADMLHAARILERWEEHVCFKTWVADYKLQVLRDLYKAAARNGWSWY